VKRPLTEMASFTKKYIYFVVCLLSIWVTPYFRFYETNFAQINLNDTLQPLLFLGCLFLIIVASLFLIIKVFPKMGKIFFLTAIVLSIALLNFDLIYHGLIGGEDLDSLIILRPENSFDKLIFFISIFLVIYSLMLALRYEFLKVFFLSFCIFGFLAPFTQIIIKVLNENEINTQKSNPNIFNIGNNQTMSLTENVYFLMLDGYASKKTSERMSLQNDNFYNYLGDNKFKMLSDKSSYNMTHLSLAGLFDLEYPINENSQKYNSQIHFYPMLLQSDQPPRLIAELNKLDYEFILYGNTWSGCHPRHLVCGGYKEGFLTNDTWVMFSNTALKKLLYRFRNYQYDAISDFLDENKNKITKGSSKFFFIHDHTVRPPYLSSNCISLSASESINDYINSTKCLNNKVYDLISSLKESDPSAIIVLQSDHGPTPSSYDAADKSSLTYMQEDNWVRIINAVKSPNNCENWLQDDLGPINTMRFILGCISQSKPVYIEEKTYLGSYTDERDYGFVREHEFNK
jgi:hypothetical protein